MATKSASTPAPYSIVSAAVLELVQYCETRGVASEPLLARFDIPRERLRDVDYRLPQATYNALFSACAETCKDSDFGLHFAQESGADGFSVVGHLVERARTVGEALESFVRYSRVVHDAGRVELTLLDEQARVYPGCRGLAHEMPRHISEYATASVLVVVRRLTGRAALHATRVCFRHAAPESVKPHRELFGVTPEFARPEAFIELDRALLSLPVLSHNPGLSGLLERLASDLLKALGDDGDLVTSVQQHMAQSLEEGAPTLASVAKGLGMSARTLQRRLQERELSFQELLDGVRRRCAERYLQNPKLSLQEVAFLLGYAEVSNFHRAVTRWFNGTPGEVRERLLST